MEIAKLFSGLLTLTFDIFIGILIGEIIIKIGLAEKVLKKIMPFLQHHNIPAVTGLAVAVAAGSSKAGAGIISSALAANEISEKTAIWSVQMLHFPAYLRRWPSTFALCVSTAGIAGGLFGVSLLTASMLRFLIAFFVLKKMGKNDNNKIGPNDKKDNAKNDNDKNNKNMQEKEKFTGALKHNQAGIIKKLLKTLPLAWIFYTLACLVVPSLNSFFRSIFASHDTVLPLGGWAVAAASVSHVRAALALAGGSLDSGELGTAQAVFALILGNCLGSATRILRMNAGYYFGLFQAKTAQKLLLWNFISIMIPSLINLIFAGLALIFTA